LEAYILINAKVGMLWKVAKALLKSSYVKRAHAVTGQYSVITFIEFDTIETLGRIINDIHAIEGVTKTQTAIVMPEHTID